MITINAGAAVSITTTSLSGGTVGTGYSTTLSAVGGSGSYTWTKSSGNLPGGLSLSSGGVISARQQLQAAIPFLSR